MESPLPHTNRDIAAGPMVSSRIEWMARVRHELLERY
jgi:hypothetical protein